MAIIIRKTFPKIRVVTVKGEKLFQIDTRKNGKGTRIHRVSRTEAEKLAAEIAQDHAKFGDEGLDFPTELRVMASRCTQQLAEYGKTIEDATQHFINFLKVQQEVESSRIVTELVNEWINDKATNKRKPLTRVTMLELEKMGRKLKDAFGELPVRTVQQDHIEDFIDRLEVQNQTRQNILVKWGQFFNWAIKKKHVASNPCEHIESYPTGREIKRYDAETVSMMLKLCESSYLDLLPYISICVFAGLRPSECERLTWEKITFDTHPPQIEVIKSTIAVKDYTRYPTIEDNLYEWLLLCKSRKGKILQPNFHKRIAAFKVDAGFQLKGENLDQSKWIPDGLRHTYASFWLAKYKAEDELVRQMGNSVAMIRQHYNKAVRLDQVERFWNILPEGTAERWKQREDTFPEYPPEHYISPEGAYVLEELFPPDEDN